VAEPALAVHGGAGGRRPRDEGPYRAALERALDAGWRALADGALGEVEELGELRVRAALPQQELEHGALVRGERLERAHEWPRG
jgi:hypothetical protein